MVNYIGEEVNKNNKQTMMVIYKAVFPNGKIYIGQTVRSIKKRIQQHKKDSKFKNFVFYKAIRKYGWENIKWYILEQCETKNELNEREIYWIEKEKSFINFTNSNGYNTTLGGNNGYRFNLLKVEDIVQFGEDYRKGMNKEELFKKYNKNGKINIQCLREMYNGSRWSEFTKITCNPIQSRILKPKEILQIIEDFKQIRNTRELANKYNVNISIIIDILKGKTYSNFTKLSDDSFYRKYVNHSDLLTNEEIVEIVKLKEEGKTFKEINNIYPNLNINFIRNILSGRILSQVTGIKFESFDIEKRKIYPRSRLKKEQVDEIIRLAKEEKKNALEIARILNIKDESAVYNVLSGKTWATYTGIAPENNLIILKQKMTAEKAISLVNDYNDGMSKKELSEKYNVSEKIVYSICSGLKWSKYTGIKHICSNGNKLNEKIVLEIVKLKECGLTPKQISEQKGISLRHIHAILSGERWNKVTHIKDNKENN